MPALLLFGRIGWFPVVTPWFPIWLVLLPLSCIAWLLSVAIGAFGAPRFKAWAKAMPVLALAAAGLHGTVIDVKSSVGLRFSLCWL